FRAAHSLKGMSATMGFPQVAALTHRMEDVFEVLRSRTDALPRTTTDVLFECLDALSGAIDSIDGTGSEQLDPTPLIARLSGLVEDEEDAAPHAAEPVAAATLPRHVRDSLREARVLHVSLPLHDETMLP